MSEFFIWLSANPIATTAIILAFSLIVISITMIYIIAFVQGRSISFWPPSIGPKPSGVHGSNKSASKETISESKPETDNANLLDSEMEPVIRKGSVLTTASGQNISITSRFYAGTRATLYRARMLRDEDVMVKVFWRGILPDTSTWKYFNQELGNTERLNHRNIVRILDRGVHANFPFIIMEYLAGGTLGSWLRTHDHTTGKDMLSILGQVADAIDFAHSQGIVHRDIKPDNILFESDANGRVALGDFGIAKVLGALDASPTAEGLDIQGSPAYIAPEAFMYDGKITKASDIYSFGVLIYEMIAGQVPFGENESPYSIMQGKATTDVPDIRTCRKDVSEEVAQRLTQALDRNPRKRPRSARGVLAGIEQKIAQL